MNRSRRRLLLTLLTLGGLLCAVWLTLRVGRVDSAVLVDIPPGFEASIIVDGLTRPSDMMFMPSGDLWVLEKGQGDTDRATAEIYAIRDGEIIVTVLQVAVNPTGDGGALAMVLDPDFETNNYFYVWYIVPGGGDRSTARLSRFTFDPVLGTADPATERDVINVTADFSSRHFGSSLLFDDEGYLLVGTGDFDLEETGAPQSSFNLISKILRIKPNHTGSTPYTVSGNPFENVSTYLPEIYSMGVRNPYRMVQRQSDGLILIGDVGRSHWEEVNELIAGANYGWPEREGICDPGRWEPCTPTPVQFTDPFYTYQHEWVFAFGRPLSGAITGMAFYEGNNFSPFVGTGDLLYSDYPLGYIQVLDTETRTARQFITGLSAPVDLEFQGNVLYILDIIDGTVMAVQYTDTNNSAPTAELTVDSTEFYTSPVTVTFTANAADADGDPLTFRYDFGDGRTVITTQTVVTHTYLADQTVTARVTATDSNGTPSLPSSETLTIYSGEWPTITLDNVTQQLTQTYHAGDSIIYEAVLSDTTGLAAEPYRWDVLLHHGAHIHPIETAVTGSANIITIPTENHDGDINVWYEWVLTLLTDDGQAVRVSREAFPELMSYAITSNLSNVGVIANGQLVTTTTFIDTIIGMENHLVGTFAVQDGVAYVPESFNSGGEVFFGREYTFIANLERDVWIVNYSSSPYRVYLPLTGVKP